MHHIFGRSEAVPDLSSANAAVWFRHQGMSEEDLEILNGMVIGQHPDESKVGKALFVKGAEAVEGNFTGANVSCEASSYLPQTVLILTCHRNRPSMACVPGTPRRAT